MFFNISLTIFCISFPLYRLIYIVNANEFQNTIISNSIKTLTEFFLIIRENLTLVYKDTRFENLLKSKEFPCDINDDWWLMAFDKESAKIITNAVNGKFSTKFDFMGLIVSVTRLSRPTNYYLITAIPKNLENIYNELFEKHGIAVYFTQKNQLISYNKPFEEIITRIGIDIPSIEQDINATQKAVESATQRFNMLISSTEFNKTLTDSSIKCHIVTAKLFDFEEIKESPIPMIYLNDDGEIIKSNNSLTRMLNLDSESQITHISEILNEDIRQYFSDTNKKGTSILKVTTRKSDTFLKLFLRKSICGWIGYFVDFSEVKALENELLHSQKLGAVGQLAGGISHDFNNILTAIIGFCDLILSENCPTSALYNDVMYIKQSASKGCDLVRHILAFSCKQKLNEEVICINNIIVTMKKFIKCIIGDGIELHIDYGVDLWFVKIDVNQFEQVLINIIINAKDAIMAANHGMIKISTENFSIDDRFKIKTGNTIKDVPCGDYILIQVKDTGSGISCEIVENIFDPFFSTKEVGKGTGLGLSTVYGIITQMNGYVYVESKLNEYTIFNLLLPRSIEKFLIEKNEKNTEHTCVSSKKNILLIEDENLIINFLTRSLNNRGYNVIIANSTEEITESFLDEHQNIDMIISDVIMPHRSGPETVEKIMEKLPNIKVIFISGYTKDKIENLNYKFEFIEKPFKMTDIISKIESSFPN